MITLLPLFFTPFSDLVSLSQSRRLVGFLPFGIALAGALLIIIQPVEPSLGREYIGRVFAVCVLGGMGSMSGTLLAALLLGVAESGVFPATLYWHIGDRSQLLGLVEYRWIEELQLPPDDAPWREWMLELGRRYRVSVSVGV